jgi:hypothetical protein
MVANNAAGTRTVRYRASSDKVLALELVPKDDIIRTCSRSVKQPAGYDAAGNLGPADGVWKASIVRNDLGNTPRASPCIRGLATALREYTGTRGCVS